MLESMQEIAIYIHRFHNVDLFQQGWYQLKITMRSEDNKCESIGSPSRVVQYETPELGNHEMCGVWRIDDTDNSFTTQPFRIKYARQNLNLCVMISFNLPLNECFGPSSSAVILKFDLLQTPITENEIHLLNHLDAPTVAIHEFRIPPKALLGLHSYCPVHFDYFHAVLVDASVHITFLRACYNAKPPKVSSLPEDHGTRINKTGQLEVAANSLDASNVLLVKALLTARDILIEDLQSLGRAIGKTVDLTEFTLEIDDMEMFGAVIESDGSMEEAPVQGNPPNSFESLKSIGSMRRDMLPLPRNLSRNAAVRIFNILGSQMSYLWNTFLHFHRSNTTAILDFLQYSWAKDRRSEWSIWMVYSKVEMPHQYIAGVDGAVHLHSKRKVSSIWKLPEDPAQTASTRAQLHRRSISHMRMNSRSIQDMYIFGDPLKIPIIYVERVTNAPRRSLSMNSYFRNSDMIDSLALPGDLKIDTIRLAEESKSMLTSSMNPIGRLLKIVVFVHGFQGHHLDLRLVRNQWLLIDPKVEFLMSVVNEEKTSGDFREMGRRLAEEVVDFIKKKTEKMSRFGCVRVIKLSFVGHSIGNLIIRAALTENIMEPYIRNLWTYLSLSGPHLGYLYSSNSLFNSGMWLLKKFKGTQCIHQLTFTDDPDIQNTFLYKLCMRKTLDNFRNIVLLSSPQDGYVPYHSARLESCQAASADKSKRGGAFIEMLNSCLDQIRVPSCEQRLFMRCDVNFDTSAYGRNFNSIIGRTAHIEFLESDIFVKFIMWSFPEIFR